MKLLQNLSLLLRKRGMRWPLFCFRLWSHLEVTLRATAAILQPQGKLALESSLHWQGPEQSDGRTLGSKMHRFFLWQQTTPMCEWLEATHIYFPEPCEACGTSGSQSTPSVFWFQTQAEEQLLLRPVIVLAEGGNLPSKGEPSRPFKVSVCMCHACSLSAG